MLKLLIPHKKLNVQGKERKKRETNVLNCRGGLKLCGEAGGFSSNF